LCATQNYAFLTGVSALTVLPVSQIASEAERFVLIGNGRFPWFRRNNMSVELIICAHCGAENLPDQEVCQACGVELEALVEYPPAPRSKILFALLALGMGFVVGALTYGNTLILGIFGGESGLYIAYYYCAPVMAFTFGVVAIILTYSWRDRIRNAPLLTGKGHPVMIVVNLIVVGITTYLVLNSLCFWLFAGLDIGGAGFFSLLCVINPFLGFVVAVVAYYWLKARRVAQA
jgi:hypothetical protein